MINENLPHLLELASAVTSYLVVLALGHHLGPLGHPVRLGLGLRLVVVGVLPCNRNIHKRQRNKISMKSSHYISTGCTYTSTSHFCSAT